MKAGSKGVKRLKSLIGKEGKERKGKDREGDLKIKRERDYDGICRNFHFLVFISVFDFMNAFLVP